MSSFFNDFRSVQYDGQLATQLMARLKLQFGADDTKAFYTYTVNDGVRPDQVAADYYGDAHLDWLVYMSNKIKDPYFEWIMDTDTLNRKIVQKYGSIERAATKILFWQVNSADSESVLSVAGYTALPAVAKKYWTPIFGATGAIAGYDRKDMTLATDTNKVVEVVMDTASQPVIGERLTQVVDVFGVTTVASARVCAVGANGLGRVKVTVNNVLGAFGTVGIDVDGEDSGVSAPCVESRTVAESFEPAEAAYWSPVSALTYETNLNEGRRQIYLISSAYADALQTELRQVLA